MTPHSFAEVLATLDAVGLRYLVAGGYAVIAHGYLRSTQDLDLIVDFTDEAALRTALTRLSEAGFRPRAPVPMLAFADAAMRHQWKQDKDMTVFAIQRTVNGQVDEIDLFAEHPFAFEAAYQAASWHALPGGQRVSFVDRQRLVRMKTQVGRPQDLADIAMLQETDGDD